MPTYRHRLEAMIDRNNSRLCVGLDPDPALMPIADIIDFNRAIIEATSDLVCAYKPNVAFYEALGSAGFDTLMATLEAIPPEVPVIADAKRGDIGNTSAAYAHAIFDNYGFDAITASPYLGRDSLEPFLQRSDRGVYVLCRTSNPGARDFQDLQVTANGQARPLYEVVAQAATAWSENVGLVVGATYPEEARRIRELCPDTTFLVPGVGTQGGALPNAVRAVADRRGSGFIINVARQILYSSRSPQEFATTARDVAQAYRDEINQCLEAKAAR